MISRNIVEEVIELANHREKRRAQSAEHTYSELNNVLFTYLSSLSNQEIKVLKTLMIIGRHGDDELRGPELLETRFQSTSFDSKDLDVHYLIGKVPLAKYLKNAMDLTGI